LEIDTHNLGDTYGCRNRTKNPPDKIHKTVYVDNAGIEYPTDSPITREEVMDDVVVENFHARSKAGEVFNNPCVYVVKTMEPSLLESNWRQVVPTNPSIYATKPIGNHTSAVLTLTSFDGWNRNLAVSPTFDVSAHAKQFALGNVDSTPHEFGEDLGELGETLRFLRKPLASIAGIARSFARKKRAINASNVTDKAKALADAWMAYQFALLPLIRSVENAMEAWVLWDESLRPARRTAHGFSEKQSTASSLHQTAPGSSHVYEFKHESLWLVNAHASILYEVTNPIDDWRYRLGLRWKDLPSTGYELIPLSFMVDRVINLKNAIKGIINLADPRVSILAASLTLRTDKQHTVSCYNEYWGYGELDCTITDPDHVQFVEFTYDRTVWLPSIADTMPVFNKTGLIDNVTKVTDLCAIIVSRLL